VNLLAAAGFGLAVLPLCLTPGVSFTLVTDRVLGAGVRAGLGVTAGTSAGLITHAVLAGAGLSALVMKSATAFTVIKLAGAAYLIVIGVRTLWVNRPEARALTIRRPAYGRSAFVQGYLGNVLNPKAAAVYLTLAPQFLDRSRPLFAQIMLLSGAHVIVAVSWLLTWTGVVHLTRRAVRLPAFRTATARITGLVLIGLGLRSALGTDSF